MLHTASATWNGTGDDVTETTYDALDRVHTTTAPSPYGGTGSGSGTRHVSTYTYDPLGRVVQVDLPGSKHTYTTYTAQGQVETVRGFGVNPVDYAYDKLGRMTELSTYQNVGGSSTGKATTTWAYDSYSGRLLNKRYQGNTGSTPDLAYTYKDSGRPLTRTTKRGIVTNYGYDSHTGEPISTTYTDSTPAVLFTKRDRLGRVTETVDAAGKHTLAYLIDGRVLSETIASDTGITNAPHSNYLSGIVLTNSYEMIAGPSSSYPDRTPRYATEVTTGSTILNHVDFVYDSEDRITELTKSYGRVAYEYDPITGQVTSSTSKVSNGGTTYSGRIRGGRTYDRLGRLSGIQWMNVPTSGLSTGFVNRMYGTDVHGRRTSMLAGVDEHSEDWAYGYDDKNQLTSGLASFSNTSPAVVVPGLQFGYTYDDIGNRTQTVQGDALTGSSAFPATYVPNPLNQYDSRTVPGKIEVTGHSPAPDVYVNSTTSAAYRYMDDDGFFHDRLSVNNSTGPERTLVQIQDAPPMGAAASYDVYTPAAAEAFTYDADGNLATDGIWTYTWDAENRLTRMVMNPGIIGAMVGQSQAWLALTFRYDGMGRRILKELDNSTDYTNQIQKGDLSSAEFSTSYIRKYVYDIGSWNLSTVLRQSGSTYYADQTFAWGPDLSGTENGAGGIGGLAIYVDDFNDGGEGAAIGPMFPVYDGNGNVLRLYDGSRDANEMPDHKLAEYKYGPFGEQRGQTGSQATRFPFRWSTKFADNESGLVYYGYRYYSPSMGSWVSRDPAAERAGTNLFSYVRNAPNNLIDPLGLCDVCDVEYQSSGILPTRSMESWQYETRRDAGLDESKWNTLSIQPTAIAQQQMSLIYAYYGQLYYERPHEFLWAGLASTVGLGVVPAIGALDSWAWRYPPLWMAVTPWETQQARKQFIRGGQEIFENLAWQHRAYVDVGLSELRAQVDNGTIRPVVFFDGWCQIAKKTKNGVASGTGVLVDYEQAEVLQKFMDQIPFRLRGWASVRAEATIPFVMPFIFFRPFGSITNGQDRLDWINAKVLPAWLETSDEERAGQIGSAMGFYLQYINYQHR